MAIECKNLEKGLRLATNGTFFACCHTFNAPFRNKEGELIKVYRAFNERDEAKFIVDIIKS